MTTNKQVFECMEMVQLLPENTSWFPTLALEQCCLLKMFGGVAPLGFIHTQDIDMPNIYHLIHFINFVMHSSSDMQSSEAALSDVASHHY